MTWCMREQFFTLEIGNIGNVAPIDLMKIDSTWDHVQKSNIINFNITNF